MLHVLMLPFNYFHADKEKCQKSFKLYPGNPCQGLANDLKLQVEILACPIGFKLKN